MECPTLFKGPNPKKKQERESYIRLWLKMPKSRSFVSKYHFYKNLASPEEAGSLRKGLGWLLNSSYTRPSLVNVDSARKQI